MRQESNTTIVTQHHTNCDTTDSSKTAALYCYITSFYTLDRSIYCMYVAHTRSPVSIQAQTYTLPVSVYTVI